MFNQCNRLKYALITCKSRISLDLSLKSFSCSSKVDQILDTAYKPAVVEKKQNKFVTETSPTNDGSKLFTMLLPPPNVTGYIHLGHCLTATVQDVIARFKRNQGYNVVWVPGTDHAGIATQIVVEKVLQKTRNTTRHQLGRDKFIEEIWKWKEDRSNKAKTDLLRLGTTLNWEREYFTMDESHSRAVREAFIRLYKRNLIYRSEAIVNWSCSLESAISDIEVDNVEIPSPQGVSVPGYSKPVTFGQIYDIAYRTDDGEEVVVSTTRPETLLGDTALAAHQDDSRYYRFDTKSFKHPFRDDYITIVPDNSVDKEFGTGLVKVTPAHDPRDFEISKRHNLKRINVIDSTGKILPGFKGYEGLPRFEAREKIISELDQLGLLKGVRPHSMTIPVCSRSKDVVEFLLRPQWFVSCNEMKEEALEAVRDGRIKIQPENFVQEWEKWLTNCHDWCISRQLWWGHRIPAYKCTDRESGKIKWQVGHDISDIKLSPDRWEIEQDEDVLDTWFSSAILPFSVFGWPASKPEPYFPLNLMETGHDILFFWVARMAMLGLELTENVPFQEILLHGIICDAHGRKMSKSLGNVISPDNVVNGITLEELQNLAKESHTSGVLTKDELEKSTKGLQKMFPSGIPECGADALRFTLCSHNFSSHFINFDVNECHTNKLFFNKIWQATRYTKGFIDKVGLKGFPVELQFDDLSNFDLWILSKLGKIQKSVNEALETYKFHFATAAIKSFFYQNLCDIYLETTKRNQELNSLEGIKNCHVLSICLSTGLDLIEPFTPFLSAELKQFVPKFNYNMEKFINPVLESEIEGILEVCATVRHLKSQNTITKKHNPVLVFHANGQMESSLLDKYKEDIKVLTSCSNVLINPDEKQVPQSSSSIIKSAAGSLGLFTIYSDKEVSQNKNLEVNLKKLEKLKTELTKLLKETSKEEYRKSASEKIQKKYDQRIDTLKTQIQNIKGIQS